LHITLSLLQVFPELSLGEMLPLREISQEDGEAWRALMKHSNNGALATNVVPVVRPVSPNQDIELALFTRLQALDELSGDVAPVLDEKELGSTASN
jgi:hypothetical protein